MEIFMHRTLVWWHAKLSCGKSLRAGCFVNSNWSWYISPCFDHVQTFLKFREGSHFSLILISSISVDSSSHLTLRWNNVIWSSYASAENIFFFSFRLKILIDISSITCPRPLQFLLFLLRHVFQMLVLPNLFSQSQGVSQEDKIV